MRSAGVLDKAIFLSSAAASSKLLKSLIVLLIIKINIFKWFIQLLDCSPGISPNNHQRSTPNLLLFYLLHLNYFFDLVIGDLHGVLVFLILIDLLQQSFIFKFV